MQDKLKVLNLYAGIGGNRKLWDNVDVTAVEINEEIAAIYKDFFPNDTVIIADAHEYLLNHFKEFDFIWSSPPCPTHSRIRKCDVIKGQNEAVYPDMRLYQEIILLQHFAPINTKYVIENVMPYYKPLIDGQIIKRHIFWTNFIIKSREFPTNFKKLNRMEWNSSHYGFNISNYYFQDKILQRQILRNLVNPEIGLMILDSARNIIRKRNTEQNELFSLEKELL